eukprot:scaffold406_cov391-Prasinococcus_capsulatus_cf.AAC.5
MDWKASTSEKEESMPRVMSMKKKRMLKKGASGIRDSAVGNTTKARPGPPSTTSSTGRPLVRARYPRMPNTTNPAKIEQLAFVAATIMPFFMTFSERSL